MTDKLGEELNIGCAGEPSVLLLRGIHEFNTSEFFEQHETLETAWRNEKGPVRELYQGILQVGVAYLQILRYNYIGSMKIFNRAWIHLALIPDICCGVDVSQFMADAKMAQAELRRLGAERIAEFNPVFFKPIILVHGLR
jgi:uncharacterized protein